MNYEDKIKGFNKTLLTGIITAMKNKILLSILAIALSVSSNCLAQDATLWEKAAIGNNPALEQVNLYGVNGGVPATFETMWPESAVYTPLLVAMSSPYCASSSAADDAAGTGARTLRVKGLTTAFAAFSEDIETDGQTSVTLTTENILVINSLEVLTTGSGLFNAGIVQCGTGANTSGDPAVTHAYLPISSATAVADAGNKSQSFIYGVAAGKTLLCRNIRAGSVFATEASSYQVAIDGYTNLSVMKRFYGFHAHNVGSNPAQVSDTIKFPEKTIIVGKMAGPTGSNVGPASLGAECVLIDNDYLEQPESIF